MKRFLLGTVFGVATAATAFAVKEIVEKKVAEEVEAELAKRNEDECDEDCPGCSVTGFGLFEDDGEDADNDEESDDSDDDSESPLVRLLGDILGVSVKTHKCDSFSDFMECVARDMKESGMSDEEIKEAVDKAKDVKSVTDAAESAADKAEDDKKSEAAEDDAVSDDAETLKDDVEETFESNVPDPTPEDVDA